MTAQDQELSVHDSRPIEAYRFTAPNSVHLYNDSDEEITINGQVYLPTSGLRRGAIDVGVSINTPRLMSVYIPFDCDVAVEQAYLTSPDYLIIEIFRVQRGTDYDTDNQKIWDSTAQAFESDGLMINITTQSIIASSLSNPLLNAVWQRSCNFILYDPDTCKANKATHTRTSDVTVVGDTAITVVDDQFDDHALVVGTALNTRTGETRLIIDNLANVITLAYGFNDVIVGDTIDLIRGCKHNSDDCVEPFNNIENYGGFKFIPRSSPLG
jgi:uncharacterized phage protein (TIGR02218 family)